MEYIEELYLRGIEDVNNVKAQLNEGVGVYGVYCICVEVSARNNLFEIIHTAEIFKEAYSYKRYLVVGIAMGKKESFLLLTTIMQDYISAYGSLDGIKQIYTKRMVGVEAD